MRCCKQLRKAAIITLTHLALVSSASPLAHLPLTQPASEAYNNTAASSQERATHTHPQHGTGICSVAGLKSCPSATEFYLWLSKGPGFRLEKLWKGQPWCLGPEGSKRGSWGAKGAWQSTDHIHKIKFSFKPLFVPHRDQLFFCRKQ